ncbi:MAG: DUF4157 domain-containing protein [Chloroflexi bacterium]|nr:DUF4157 domain-containing protein [Chloroflexota bacterium]
MSDSQLSFDDHATRRRSSETAPQSKLNAPPAHPLIRLQRQVGNSVVSRMLAQRTGEEEMAAKHDPALAQRAEEEEMAAKHDPALAQRAEEEEMAAKHDPALAQRAEEEEMAAKHDPALAQREGEEEEMAAKHDPALAQREGEEEEMAAKHDPALAQREGEEEEMAAKHDPALAQRADEEEMAAKHDPALAQRAEEEEMAAKHDPALGQRKAAAPRVGLEGGAIGEDLQARINSRRGSGSALNDGLRGTMERSMGASFADVRVHRDPESDALNRSITAKAFTTGSDIFLREDQNPTDSHLLAHELTHVVQQRAMGGRGGGGMTVGAHDDAHEQQADAVSQAVNSGAQRRVADEVKH